MSGVILELLSLSTKIVSDTTDYSEFIYPKMQLSCSILSQIFYKISRFKLFIVSNKKRETEIVLPLFFAADDNQNGTSSN